MEDYSVTGGGMLDAVVAELSSSLQPSSANARPNSFLAMIGSRSSLNLAGTQHDTSSLHGSSDCVTFVNFVVVIVLMLLIAISNCCRLVLNQLPHLLLSYLYFLKELWAWDSGMFSRFYFQSTSSYEIRFTCFKVGWMI